MTCTVSHVLSEEFQCKLPHPGFVSSVHGIDIVMTRTVCTSKQPGMGPCTDVFSLGFTQDLFA